jgi:phenylacetate-coenzyme A ligase PaaK-like adenylate-forming protein
LPSDLWQVKGIITSGLDSSVYREKIKSLWGRYPLDIYACTEGSVIATQTWDYGSMTFIPHLNFLEFIPEKEYLKWQLDKRYQPRTVLLNEVQPGENYEIVISNFHGGALVRYRVGDMIRITGLRNENLGIEIPQMLFARRADDLLDFVVIRLTEKKIWEAIEKTGIPYRDWVAFKRTGEPVLQILMELNEESRLSEKQAEMAIYEQIIRSEIDDYTTSRAHDDLTNMIKFRVKVTLLPSGAFASYTSARQSEGADLAHLKPPHINPPQKVLERLLASAGISIAREEEAQIA